MDRRITNQEKYLSGKVFKREVFSATSKNDHDHCCFCFEKFTDGSECLSTKNGKYRICKNCFDDFSERFGMKLK